MPKTKSTTCKLCGEPIATKSYGLARCEVHLREYWRDRDQKRKQRPTRARPTGERVRVIVTGDKVTMDLATFHRLMAGQGHPPAPRKPGKQLAVVSADLGRVLLMEATDGQVQELDESQYAQQLMDLREAGYRVCVEG